MVKNRKNNIEEEETASREDWRLEPGAKRGIVVVLIVALAGVSGLALFDLAGKIGVYMNYYLTLAFGDTRWLLPMVLLFAGYLLLDHEAARFRFLHFFSIVLGWVSLNGFVHLLKIEPIDFINAAQFGEGGGYLGLALGYSFFQIMGFWAALIVLSACLLIAVLILFNTSLKQLGRLSFFWAIWFKKMHAWWQSRGPVGRVHRHEEHQDDESEELEADTEDEKSVDTKKSGWLNFGRRPVGEAGATTTTTDETKTGAAITAEVLESFDMPVAHKRRPKIDLPLTLLSSKKTIPNSGDIDANAEKIKKTLNTFGISVDMDEVNVGPTVTQYTLKPADGVKLSQIITLSNDLALSLAAHPIRIEAPIPGKSLVGIEVPNQAIAAVMMKELLESKEFQKRKHNMMIVLGKDVSGKPWLADMTTMPHLLIAGATGSGKTVCINTLILSLLFQNGPDDLKLILVDPKRVEMTGYNGIPHLLTPVITDTKKTVNALKWAITEMDRRFEVLSKFGKRDIHAFNAATEEKLPFIVIIIDELADVMATAGNDVEGLIVRLAQMARAVGIHLVLATQRPSVDVITGLIKANVTARIAFSVVSLMDSRTILDTSGAEKLLGRGDMLFINAQLSKPKRLQGVYCSDPEIEAVVHYIKDHSDVPDYNEDIVARNGNSGGLFIGSGDEGDDLYNEAKEEIVRVGKASASFLQRRLKIGYARAARLIDLLEEAGIVSKADGAKPRDVLLKPEELADEEAIKYQKVMEAPQPRTSPAIGGTVLGTPSSAVEQETLEEDLFGDIEVSDNSNKEQEDVVEEKSPLDFDEEKEEVLEDEVEAVGSEDDIDDSVEKETELTPEKASEDEALGELNEDSDDETIEDSEEEDEDEEDFSDDGDDDFLNRAPKIIKTNRL